MSFSEKLTKWFTHAIFPSLSSSASESSSSAYNNTVDETTGGLVSGISGAGGGLGGALLTIPGVGSQLSSALATAQNDLSGAVGAASSYTPAQLAASNEAAEKLRIETLQKAAAAKGQTVQQYQEEQAILANKTYSINDFFNTVFTNTIYLCIFIAILALALLGSSLAANSAYNKPIAFRIYYMIYGFILFPVAICMGIYNYMKGKKLFHAIWAPLHETYIGKKTILNLFIFPFIYKKPGVADATFGAPEIAKHPHHGHHSHHVQHGHHAKKFSPEELS